MLFDEIKVFCIMFTHIGDERADGFGIFLVPGNANLLHESLLIKLIISHRSGWFNVSPISTCALLPPDEPVPLAVALAVALASVPVRVP